MHNVPARLRQGEWRPGAAGPAPHAPRGEALTYAARWHLSASRVTTHFSFRGYVKTNKTRLFPYFSDLKTFVLTLDVV